MRKKHYIVIILIGILLMFIVYVGIKALGNKELTKKETVDPGKTIENTVENTIVGNIDEKNEAGKSIIIDDYQVRDMKDINEINILGKLAEINITYIDEDKIDVRLKGEVNVNSKRNIPKLELQVKNNSVTIEEKIEGDKLSLIQETTPLIMEVSIPRKHLNKVYIKNVYGNLVISGRSNSIDELNIYNDQGFIELDLMNVSKSKIVNNKGDISILSSNSALDLTTQEGDIKILNHTTVNEIFIKQGTGSIYCNIPYDKYEIMNGATSKQDNYYSGDQSRAGILHIESNSSDIIIE